MKTMNKEAGSCDQRQSPNQKYIKGKGMKLYWNPERFGFKVHNPWGTTSHSTERKWSSRPT
eukprot:5729039-Prorocentrum_lima.AAC.1